MIVAGECETRVWCATCQAPTRVRLALHDGTPDGTLLAVVEVCPGCGSNHATPSVNVTTGPVSLLERLRPKTRPPEQVCAWADCRKPVKQGHRLDLVVDDGVWHVGFCSDDHKRAWALEHWVVLPDMQPFPAA